MTEEAKQDIINYLKSLQVGQPFTMEDLVRTMGLKKGEPWTMYEVQYIEEIEKYLLQEGLIKDTGKTTKLYNSESKVNKL